MTRARLFSTAAMFVLLGSIWAAPASAHTRSLSHSIWNLEEGGARVHARVSQLDLSRLGLAFAPAAGGRDPIGAYLARHLSLRAGGQPCEVASPPTPRETDPGAALYVWRVTCAGDGPREIESSLFLDVAPSHLHFARIEAGDGAGTERVLSEASRSWTLPVGDAASQSDGGGTTLGGYLVLGVEHILTGWDHLAFVIALLLLAVTLREVATLVTAFTVAHSVTLGLATLGWVEPHAGAVEALIGFSIALVAAENTWLLADRRRAIPIACVAGLLALALLPAGSVGRGALLGLALFSACHFGLLEVSQRPARLRAAVAFAFGLVHGFGFAGILAELELPTARLVPALFGFNIGVELGQLAVVVLVWPLLRALARVGDGRAERLTAEFASAAVGGLGLYWFVVRHFG